MPGPSHFINNLQNEGHNVVLGMDANENVRKGKISKALEDNCMSESIVKFHKDRSPPATFTTNKKRKVIDSIWMSPGIHILCCGFFPFHDLLSFISDHRLIWANICNQSLYGHQPQHFFRAPACRVKSNDPASKKQNTQHLYQ